MWNTWECTWIADLLGGNTYLQSVSNNQIKVTKTYWLIGRKSQLSLKNKMLLYKFILKSVWSNGIELWGTAANSNIDILERFQNKIMRMIVRASYYVPKYVIKCDLEIPSVKTEIRTRSIKYWERVVRPVPTPTQHTAKELFQQNEDTPRIKRFRPTDLIHRFA